MSALQALVTGGAGFIGSHFLRTMLQRHSNWAWHIIDRLNYAASLHRIADLRGRIHLHLHDLRAPIPDHLARQLGDLDYVFHFGAETHVDRSMVDPTPFVETNVLGTFNLLEHCRLREPKLRMFFYISTDESVGPAPAGVDHKEDAEHKPSNPYSATKAAAEDLCFAWNHSMGVPVIRTRTMNNIAESQHPEKYVPKIIRALLRQQIITVHGSPDESGSRKYLYAPDHADAIDFLLTHGRRGETYNVVGAEEVSNLDMVRRIEKIMRREARIKFLDFHATRPGHDLRYSLDGGKMAKMGWTPPTSLNRALEQIVAWSVQRPEWLGLPKERTRAEVSKAKASA